MNKFSVFIIQVDNARLFRRSGGFWILLPALVVDIFLYVMKPVALEISHDIGV